nr:hypothetical protein CFP56_62707 [Quercus suber]
MRFKVTLVRPVPASARGHSLTAFCSAVYRNLTSRPRKRNEVQGNFSASRSRVRAWSFAHRFLFRSIPQPHITTEEAAVYLSLAKVRQLHDVREDVHRRN